MSHQSLTKPFQNSEVREWGTDVLVIGGGPAGAWVAISADELMYSFNGENFHYGTPVYPKIIHSY